MAEVRLFEFLEMLIPLLLDLGDGADVSFEGGHTGLFHLQELEEAGSVFAIVMVEEEMGQGPPVQVIEVEVLC